MFYLDEIGNTSQSVALWGLHKGGKETVREFGSRNMQRKGTGGREGREQCMMKREKRRKESGDFVQMGEKELYLPYFSSIIF